LDAATRKGTRPGGIGVLEAVDTAVDAAAMQLMSKAMKFISLEDSPPPSRTSPQQKSGGPSPLRSRSPTLNKPDVSSSTASFFDKGLDAFGSMGKFVEGFAVTLDTVIGQAFEDWGTPKAPGREGKKKVVKPVGLLPSPAQLTSSGRSGADGDGEGLPRGRSSSHQWVDFDVEEEQGLGSLLTPGSITKSLGATSIAPVSAGGAGGGCSTPGAPAASPYTTNISAKGQTVKEIQLWRRRAQILQKELQKLRAQRDEYQHVKKEYETLQNELKNRSKNDHDGSGGRENNANTTDSLASEQVMGQMEALMAEKARLAQENDRLLRENTSLHELLEFTMQHHVADLGDDELFGVGDDELYGENYEGEPSEEPSEEVVEGEDSFETAEGGSPAFE
jgi:hypothetical protein